MSGHEANRCPQCGARIRGTVEGRRRKLLIQRNCLLGAAVVMGTVLLIDETHLAGRNRSSVVDLVTYTALGAIIAIWLFLLVVHGRNRCDLCGSMKR